MSSYKNRLLEGAAYILAIIVIIYALLKQAVIWIAVGTFGAVVFTVERIKPMIERLINAFIDLIYIHDDEDEEESEEEEF